MAELKGMAAGTGAFKNLEGVCTEREDGSSVCHEKRDTPLLHYVFIALEW